MNKYVNKDAFKNAQVGDSVTRVLCGELKMPLKVTKVTESRIFCGMWEFDRVTGAEIDEELGWNEVATGSYIVKEN